MTLHVLSPEPALIVNSNKFLIYNNQSPRVCELREKTMQTSSNISTNSVTQTSILSASLQISAAILLGTILLYGVGFASSDVAHNAAHDARHTFAFPCH